MRTYLMQDCSGGKVNRTDYNLSFQQMYHMTDYTDQEIESIIDLSIGETFLVGSEQDILIQRIS